APDAVGRAGAGVEHQPGGDLEAVLDKGGIDAALKAIARIARYTELATGRGGAHRVEQCRLDKDLGCALGAAGGLAANHTAKALHPGSVFNRGNFSVQDVFLAV